MISHLIFAKCLSEFGTNLIRSKCLTDASFLSAENRNKIFVGAILCVFL